MVQDKQMKHPISDMSCTYEPKDKLLGFGLITFMVNLQFYTISCLFLIHEILNEPAHCCQKLKEQLIFSVSFI